jgi:Zn-dependent peptidase ImmA (M78 family)
LDDYPTSKRLRQLRDQAASIVAHQENERLSWLAGLRKNLPLPGRIQGDAREWETRWDEIVEQLRLGDDAAAAEALAADSSPLVIKSASHAALLFSSVSPTITSRDVKTLTSVLLKQYAMDWSSPELDRLSESITPDAGIPAWEQGYALAESILEVMPQDYVTQWVDVEKILQHLGVAVVARSLDDPNIRACAIVGPRMRATVVHNDSSSFSSSANAKRFSMAHEFCHLLFDRSRGRKLAIASGPWAPELIERRANAFAAMFLMPARLIERAIADLPDPVSDPESIRSLAERLKVSRQAAIEHLYNLTSMSDSDRDALLRQIAQ